MTVKHAPATPLTDALSTDPAIEKRDVPSRVWREMARLEIDRRKLVEALRGMIAAADEFVRDTGLKHVYLITERADIGRALLRSLEEE